MLSSGVIGYGAAQSALVAAVSLALGGCMRRPAVLVFVVLAGFGALLVDICLY